MSQIELEPIKKLISSDPFLDRKWGAFLSYISTVYADIETAIPHIINANRCALALERIKEKQARHHRRIADFLIKKIMWELDRIPTARGRPFKEGDAVPFGVELSYVLQRQGRNMSAQGACQATAKLFGLEYEVAAKILHSKRVRARCPFSAPPREYAPPTGHIVR